MLTKLRLSILTLSIFTVYALFFISCTEKPEKISVIFDTDTNNELDDQHALAYLLFNQETFDIKAVTVNTTRGGGRIAEQMAEAARVIALCGKSGSTTLLPGADASFNDIVNFVGEPVFDGSEAVNKIIEEARNSSGKQLTVIAVGKLTNPALAIAKAPEISKMIRLVWLGANYPDPGEYNLDNDTAALNYILASDVPFEIALVRYGKGNGTDAVRVTQEEIHTRMPGKGPSVQPPVTGRHGGEFTNFGDYSVNLFDHINLHGADKSRALFDMAAVAIVKNPAWASFYEIPAPRYVNKQWVEQPDNTRKITIWENFNKAEILADFFKLF